MPPFLAGSNWSGSALFLEGVDLEAVGHLIVVDRLPVDLHGEDAARALAEVGGDPVRVLDGGLQTGGLGEVVSLSAVGDPGVHPTLLVSWVSRTIVRSVAMA